MPMVRVSNGGTPAISELLAVNTNWTASQNYDCIYVIGLRASTPTITFTGQGTPTRLSLVTYESQKVELYRIDNVKSGDKITTYFQVYIMA